MRPSGIDLIFNSLLVVRAKNLGYFGTRTDFFKAQQELIDEGFDANIVLAPNTSYPTLEITKAVVKDKRVTKILARAIWLNCRLVGSFKFDDEENTESFDIGPNNSGTWLARLLSSEIEQRSLNFCTIIGNYDEEPEPL